MSQIFLSCFVNGICDPHKGHMLTHFSLFSSPHCVFAAVPNSLLYLVMGFKISLSFPFYLINLFILVFHIDGLWLYTSEWTVKNVYTLAF